MKHPRYRPPSVPPEPMVVAVPCRVCQSRGGFVVGMQSRELVCRVCKQPKPSLLPHVDGRLR